MARRLTGAEVGHQPRGCHVTLSHNLGPSLRMDPRLPLGIDRQRADKRQTVHEANQIVGAGRIWSRSQPREPGLLDGWINQEEGLKAAPAGLSRARPEERLRPVVGQWHARRGRSSRAPPSGRRRTPRRRNSFTIAVTIGRPFSVALGGLGGCQKSRTAIVARCSPDAQVLRQAATVLKACRNATRIGCKDVRGRSPAARPRRRPLRRAGLRPCPGSGPDSA